MTTLNNGGEFGNDHITTAVFENLGEVRENIDGIDSKLVELLNKRAELVLIARGFKRANSSTYDIIREHEIIGNVTEENMGPFQDQQLSKIFFTILSESRGLQVTEIKESLVPEENA